MRSTHIATIKATQADIEKNIDSYSFFALDERAKKLQSDWHKVEAKNLKISTSENGVAFDAQKFFEENLQLDNLVMDLKAKIRTQMTQLEIKGKEQHTVAGESIVNVGVSNK